MKRYRAIEAMLRPLVDSTQGFDASELAYRLTELDQFERSEVAGQVGEDRTQAGVVRLLGLNHENAFIDNTEFDEFGQLIGCRVRIFDSKANAEEAQDGNSYAEGLIATYTMEAVHEGVGKLKTYRYVKNL